MLMAEPATISSEEYMVLCALIASEGVKAVAVVTDAAVARGLDARRVLPVLRDLEEHNPPLAQSEQDAALDEDVWIATAAGADAREAYEAHDG
jgi:hypothetical protein